MIASKAAGPVAAGPFIVTVSSTPPQKADLAASLTCPANAAIGAAVTCTVSVHNNGPATTQNLLVPAVIFSRSHGPISATNGGVVSGSIAVWSVPPLGSGATFTASLTTTFTAGGTPSVVAFALATNPDPNIFNNLALRAVKIT